MGLGSIRKCRCTTTEHRKGSDKFEVWGLVISERDPLCKNQFSVISRLDTDMGVTFFFFW